MANKKAHDSPASHARPAVAAYLVLLRELRWSREFFLDSSELIWNTYGVRSDVGCNVEKLACSGHAASMGDFEWWVEDLAREDGAYDRAAFGEAVDRQRLNRFSFERRPRPLPRGLSVALHLALGKGVKRTLKTYERAGDLVALRGEAPLAREVAPLLAKKLATLTKWRAQMAARFAVEHPGRSTAY